MKSKEVLGAINAAKKNNQKAAHHVDMPHMASLPFVVVPLVVVAPRVLRPIHWVPRLSCCFWSCFWCGAPGWRNRAA